MNPGSNAIIISDVHSNIIALREIFKHFNFEYIIHAGDVVGYNPYPKETISFFIEKKIKSIRGNHDRSIITGDFSNFNDIAAIALEWTIQKLDYFELNYLKSLKSSMKIELFGRRVAVFHGSPYIEDEYIYEEDLDESLIPKGVDVLILGHTHIPYVKRFGDKLIINPGSVGQPRDGDPRSSFALIDKDWNVKIIRVEYDIDEINKKIKDVGLPEILGTRLYHGL